jgi:hypothetical protein
MLHSLHQSDINIKSCVKLYVLHKYKINTCRSTRRNKKNIWTRKVTHSYMKKKTSCSKVCYLFLISFHFMLFHIVSFYMYFHFIFISFYINYILLLCCILFLYFAAGGFIPMIPEVVLVRDISNRSVTLTWSRRSTSEPVAFVVHEREERRPQHLRHWTVAHLVSSHCQRMSKKISFFTCSASNMGRSKLTLFTMLWIVSNRKSHQFRLGLLKIFSIEKKEKQHVLCTLHFLFMFIT